MGPSPCDYRAAREVHGRGRLVPGVRLNVTGHDQDEQDQKQQAQAATTVVAGAIERSTAPVPETAEQSNDEDDEEDGAEHGPVFRGDSVRQRVVTDTVPRRPIGRVSILSLAETYLPPCACSWRAPFRRARSQC